MANFSLSILKAELTADPESRGWATMTDQQVAGDMNELRYPGAVSVTFTSLVSMLGDSGQTDPVGIVRRLVDSMRAAGQSDSIIDEALRFVRSGGSIDLGNPQTRGILDSLAADTTLDLETADAAAIKGLADNKVSYAQKKGWPKITSQYVQQARAL